MTRRRLRGKPGKRCAFNEHVVEGDRVLIRLAGGLTAVVDVSDLPLVSAYHWYAFRPVDGKTPYAMTNAYRADGKRVRLRMHRLLLNAPPDKEVDHVNRNGLDNRRANMRLCSRSQNAANMAPRKQGYKGAYYHEVHRRWYGRIATKSSRCKYLGHFATAEEAARAYDAAAKQVHGEFAYLNFPAEAGA